MTSTDAVNHQNLSPEDTSKRPRSRSPHPYHRSSISITAVDALNIPDDVLHDVASESSTERGTEADDEKGPILRALPAPPLKYRKGWRGSKSPLDLTPAVTPLLSLSGKEEDHTYFNLTRQKRSTKGKAQAVKNQIDDDRYQKYVARRRAEIVRRATEATLLLSIVATISHHSARSGKLKSWSNEIYDTGRIVGIVYTLYPVAMALRLVNAGSTLISAFRQAFHIPSRFDPGPLLYPVFIPFCIALSLSDLDKSVVYVNLVLGIASIPAGMISKLFPPCTSWLHWVLCLLPRRSEVGLVVTASELPSPPQSSLFSPNLDSETLVLLFPLHQTLLAVLQHLTTTSLDPAELQLLSTGLINLLLFAKSPQAQILRAIVWLGSLCLFISCRRPLAWEVTLARIPAWKFVRNKSPKSGVLSKVEGVVYLMLSSQHQRHNMQLDSDDEDYDHLRLARKRVRHNSKKLTGGANSLVSETDQSTNHTHNVPMDKASAELTRSITLPEPRQSHGLRRSSLLPSRSGFLALTYAQAQAFKWIFAIYIFTATIFIILVILRPFIGQHALHGYEPFGWALGYLFGNIAQARFFIVSHNLERWISLPQHAAHIENLPLSGWLEKYRQTQQGSANVRLFLAAYCLFILMCGLLAVFRLGTVAEVDTRRKVFHGIMVAMLLPTIPVDPCFIALALIIILSIFLLLDLFRASQVPPISKPLTAFLAPYVDGRDHRGPVIISHIFLLIGCAIPLWLALAGSQRAGQEPWVGWDVTTRDLSMISGVVCVGMGDAAASLIGRRYGRTKWFWGGGKSVEGSCAFAIAVTIGLMASYAWLRVGGWVEWDTHAIPQATLKALTAASGASLLESVLTAANDNVVVPIGLWLLVRGLDL